ncbi:TPA: Ig-like domain-containing protein [Enterococcus faecium]
MKKKWIGLFLSLLLLTGSIAPNAYAVTQSSTSDELKTEHTTETSTQPMSESTTHESTNDSLPQDSAKEEDSGEYSENNEITEKIEINKSNFPDDHFRNWLLEMIDTDKDGYLSNELLEITQLNLEGLQIQTLEGVNFFKNLTKIEVQNNELKELDVHELKKLAYLDVLSNQLSKIDLSQNSELTYFKGENQTVTSIANKMDNKWEINDETLKPEKEQTTLETEKWQYDGSHFYSSEQTPLSYIYEVYFSDDAVLEEAAEKTLTVKVTVEYMEPEQKEADSIVPDSSSIVLKKGETKQLAYTSVPDGSIISDPLWESSDPSVVEVDENGKVTAKEAGEAKVELKNAEKVLGEFTVIVEAEKNESQTKETAQTSDETTDRSPIYRRSALAATPTITYQTHVQDIGWQTPTANGEVAGTTGQKKKDRGYQNSSEQQFIKW